MLIVAAVLGVLVGVLGIIARWMHSLVSIAQETSDALRRIEGATFELLNTVRLAYHAEVTPHILFERVDVTTDANHSFITVVFRNAGRHAVKVIALRADTADRHPKSTFSTESGLALSPNEKASLSLECDKGIERVRVKFEDASGRHHEVMAVEP